MARIIVTPDQAIPGAAPVLLDESVYSVHLSTGHAAMQLIERLSWALNDAEAIERSQADRNGRTHNRTVPPQSNRGDPSREAVRA